MTSPSIIGAFSADQVSQLTGLSRNQLRSWNRTGFIRPEFPVGDNPRSPFSHIYSFKDLLKLRVLNQLRNLYRVPMSELRRVERELSDLGDEKWTSQRLWVFNRKVVFVEPESTKKREIVSGQFVAPIALEVVTSDARKDIEQLNRRDSRDVGKIIKNKHVHSAAAVFSGTRIPVSAILDYLKAGYREPEILDRYPSLEAADIDAARNWHDEAA